MVGGAACVDEPSTRTNLSQYSHWWSLIGEVVAVEVGTYSLRER